MTDMDPWPELGGPPPEKVIVNGVELRKGSLVRVRPRSRGDIFDASLSGRVAVVEGIDQDLDDNTHVAVIFEDDPGRDLGAARQPGHRFFFSADEVEPLEGASAPPPPARILVAGIGNIFLGDDGFGVEVANRLASRQLPPEVKVVDFGIRGLDLAYELQEGYETVIFLDATPRGEAPGTLYVIEHDPQTDDEDGEVPLDTHGMDPLKVLGLARRLGRVPDRTLVVGCEPQTVLAGDSYDDMLVELSDPVRAAIEAGVSAVESLLADLLSGNDSATAS